MPFVAYLIEAASRRFTGRLRSRFADGPARFRTAVASGFVVAAVGALLIGGDWSGFADSFFDLFNGSLFGQAPAPQPSAPWPGRRTASHLHARQAHVARSLSARRVLARTVATAAAASHRAPVALARQSMCVRLCDGFAFPVGAYHGEEDRAPHEAACQSQCPSAQTALYVMPVGTDAMREAVRVGTGQAYSQLPDAFHYTAVLSDACACHPPSGNRIKSLLHDFTLRRGDAVMTGSGVQVFHGGARYPFSRRDFMALARSPDVRRADWRVFHAIERASVTSTVAVVPPTRPNDTMAQNGPAQNDPAATIR